MWQVVPGQALAFREWDGEAVLYNDLSGSTHLLEGAAVELLFALRERPADSASLAAQLAERFGASAGDADFQAEIDEMLNALARLDLVETC